MCAVPTLNSQGSYCDFIVLLIYIYSVLFILDMCSSASLQVQKSIKIYFWNLHGTKSKIVNDKLSDSEFLGKIGKSDMVGLAELHTSEEASLPGFKLVKQKFRKKCHKGPKISGGIAVFVRNDLKDSVEVAPNKKDSIWVKIKQKRNGGGKVEKYIYVGTYYVNPRKANNPNDFFTSLNEEISLFRKKGEVFVQGDLNARTVKDNDFIEYDKFDEEMGIQNFDNQCSRNSEDRKANPRGSELLDVCKLNDFLILNGRTTGDLFGSFTSHQWNGSSVVDYALTSNIFTKNILEFRVGNFVPWLSDHCPLDITICINKPLVRNVSIEEAITDVPPGFMWNGNTKNAFAEGLTSILMKQKIRILEENNDISPVALVAEIKSILLSNAVDCKLKTFKKSNRVSKLGPMV